MCQSLRMIHRRVLVTGSSRGIGRAIALRLAEDGWRVAVHGSRPSDELKDIASELGDSCAGVYAEDLADPKGAARLFQKCHLDGAINALVNNAGIYVPHDLVRCNDDDFSSILERTMQINFRSPLHLTRLVCREFLAFGGGRVLQVGSRVGIKGEAGAALYAASKAAQLSMVKSLAVEHAKANIRHFGIAPGWVETAMARDGMDNRLPEILSTIPLGRMAKPEDCANAARFLLSGEADYMSGITLDINGASYIR